MNFGLAALLQVPLPLHDATDSVRQIGLAATLVIVLIGIVIVILRWAAKRLDQKDDRIVKITDERREDLVRMVETQQELSRGQEKIADSLTALADELRSKRKR